jgi:hypothetical protein
MTSTRPASAILLALALRLPAKRRPGLRSGTSRAALSSKEGVDRSPNKRSLVASLQRQAAQLGAAVPRDGAIFLFCSISMGARSAARGAGASLRLREIDIELRVPRSWQAAAPKGFPPPKELQQPASPPRA